MARAVGHPFSAACFHCFQDSRPVTTGRPGAIFLSGLSEAWIVAPVVACFAVTGGL